MVSGTWSFSAGLWLNWDGVTGAGVLFLDAGTFIGSVVFTRQGGRFTTTAPETDDTRKTMYVINHHYKNYMFVCSARALD